MRRLREKGFTLIEFMVATTVSTLVLIAIYVVYATQSRSYVAQEHISEMQQNLRAAMYMIGRDLRMAGYDPFSREDKLEDGLDNDCDGGDPDESGELIGVLVAKKDSITVNMSLYDGVDNDNDGDTDELDEAGLIDIEKASTAGLEPCGIKEIVTYSLFDSDWQARCVGRKTGMPENSAFSTEAIAENIDALDFVYLDEDRNVLDDGGGGVEENRDKIRIVQVTIVAKSRNLERHFEQKQVFYNLQNEVVFDAPQDNYRRLSQSVEIRCRNLGIAQTLAEREGA